MTSLDNITQVLFPPKPAVQSHPLPWWMSSDTPMARPRRRIIAIGDTVWTVVIPAKPPAAKAKTPYNAVARTMGIIAG